jgi:hypothetical protein
MKNVEKMRRLVEIIAANFHRTNEISFVFGVSLSDSKSLLSTPPDFKSFSVDISSRRKGL